MSDLRVNSIAGADGTSPATLVKQSAAKAFANLNGTGTIAFRGSFNMSSATDNGTGDYTYNMSNAMANANYTLAAFNGFGGTGDTNSVVLTGGELSTARTVSLFRLISRSSTIKIDTSHAEAVVNGDLA